MQPHKNPKKLGGAKDSSFFLGLLGSLVALFLWWVFTNAASANTLFASFSPARIPAAFASLLQRGVLLSDALISLYRLLAGLTIAILLGLPLGLVLGLKGCTEQLSAPLIQFFRMVSPLSWAPIAVALFGVGSAPVIFLLAIAAIWPITFNTLSGVKALNPQHLQVAQTLGASRTEIIKTVVIPSIRPYVLSGIRLALGIAWVIIVPAEMLGVSSGLGYEILNARDRLAYDEMLAVILLIGLLGICLDWLAQKLLSS
ncbi:MAG: ABC transporter permease [Rothia sp. (in: high G+C Gram-positive bacteria)]|nr:ABC transporter permease [Rothia sp. (in: high G+C Gram-positive bacteria)]